ncbi:MAG TPA: hypothetical protein VLC29_00825 [Rhizomicrobium sp.]|nr:hypothetical protein [Rhizomicrobium sp.]
MKAAARLAVMWVPVLLWGWLVVSTVGTVHDWAALHVTPVAGKPLSDFGVIVAYIGPIFLMLWAGMRIGLHYWPRDLTGPGRRNFATNE